MTSRWEAFLTGRVGFAPSESLLLFASTGLAAAEFSLDDLPCPSRCSGFQLSGRDVFGGTRFGYTIGLGADYALDEHMSIRGQYQFADYGRLETRDDYNTNVAWSSFNTHTLIWGLAYHLE